MIALFNVCAIAGEGDCFKLFLSNENKEKRAKRVKDEESRLGYPFRFVFVGDTALITEYSGTLYDELTALYGKGSEGICLKTAYNDNLSEEALEWLENNGLTFKAVIDNLKMLSQWDGSFTNATVKGVKTKIPSGILRLIEDDVKEHNANICPSSKKPHSMHGLQTLLKIKAVTA